MYQPLVTDLKIMEKQCQDMDVRFLLGLNCEYSVCVQTFGGLGLPSLPKVFSLIQCATLFDHGLR